MDIGTRIRILRTSIGYTQSDFANKLEIKQAIISAWELGAQRVPDSRLYQICQTFNVRRTWLETGQGEMFGKVKPRLTRYDTFIDVALELYKALPEEQRDVVTLLAERITEINRSQRK